MCGHSSFLFTEQSSWISSDVKSIFLKSAEKLSHRGNEQMHAEFFDALFLAHFRLAFQDLQANVQPLFSFDRKWVILYNGEIYNHRELKEQIQKKSDLPFRTHGDTEVILNGFLLYGADIVSLLEGEYSFVIFRVDGSEAFAFRDPSGVKPLFLAAEGLDTDSFAIANEQYEFQTKALNFSSEIKGLAIKKKWHREGFLRQAVGLYEPIRTPFEHVIQIPQNSHLHAKRNGDYFSVTLKLNPIPIRYVSSSSIGVSSPQTTVIPAKAGIHTQDLHFYGNDTALKSDFVQALRSSVRERTLSDVELGVYLSGGVDSKVVAYELSQFHHSGIKPKNKIKSFTIGFSDQDYDETQQALSFAHAMNLDPHLIQVSQSDLQYAYPHAVYHSENIQPYTNGAAKWWLSCFTSQSVSGVLTGDGADELLCGYPSFRYANWWKFARRNRKFDESSWRDGVYQKKFASHSENPWLHGSSHKGTGEDFIQSLSLWGVAHPLFEEIKSIAIGLLGEQEGMDFLSRQTESIQSWFAFGLNQDPEFLSDSENTLLLWQNYFFKTHLPVQVLNWVGDRMEMAHTLEGRTPFLSGKMREFVRGLPDVMMVRGFEEKSILRRAYQPMLKKFVLTPKRQFNAPFLLPHDHRNWKSELVERLSQNDLLEKSTILNLIKNNDKSQNSDMSYSNIYRQSALQMLSSFAILDHSLVNENNLTRDFNAEARVLSKGRRL